MSSSGPGTTRLREVLGADPPAGVAALPAADQTILADLVRAARAAQARDLDEAFEAVLRSVPFPVRPIARKILRG